MAHQESRAMGPNHLDFYIILGRLVSDVSGPWRDACVLGMTEIVIVAAWIFHPKTSAFIALARRCVSDSSIHLHPSTPAAI